MQEFRPISGDHWGAGGPAGRSTPGFVHLGELFGLVERDKWLIGALTAFFMAIGLIYGFSATPLYEARASLILDPRERRLLSGDEVVSQLPVSDAVVASEIAALRSSALIEKTIATTGLAQLREFKEDLVTPSGLGAVLRPIRVLLGLASADLPEGPTRTRLIEEFRKRLTVSQDGISYVIVVSFYSDDPRLAAFVANAHVDAYVAEQQTFRREATSNASEWLEERVATLQAQAEEAEAAAVARRLELLSVDIAGREIVAQQLADLSTALSNARAERVEIEARFNQVTALVEAGGAFAAAGALTGQVPDRLLAERDRLRQEIAGLSAQFGTGNAGVMALQNTLNEVEQSIERQVLDLVRRLKGDLEVVRTRETSLEENVNELEARSLAQAEASVEIDRLQREAAATRDLYGALLVRLNETRAQQAFETADARIVSRALVPDGPYAPRKRMILAAAGFVGVMLGVALAALRHLLRRGVLRQADVARSVDAPVLATVPRLETRSLCADTLSHWLKEEGDAAIDHLSTLQHLLIDRGPQSCKSIAMVSAGGSEGKTTTSLLLAHACTRAGRRSLVIEADLRKRSFFDGMLGSETGSIAAYAAGACHAAEAIVTLNGVGFSVLPGVHGAYDTSNMLSYDRVEQLIADVGARYDIVIFDTAPVLVAAETLAVGRAVDATLFVARAGQTQLPEIERAMGLLNASGCTLSGVILNEAGEKDLILSSSYYGYAPPRRWAALR
ncbi:MAG: polysaccharide biosynthesis tyrosine autokinase [Pseudomonadota bacterium]